MKMNYIQYISELKMVYGDGLVDVAVAEMVNSIGDSGWNLFTNGDFSLLEPYLP